MRWLQIIATLLVACGISVSSQTNWQAIDADGLFTFRLPKGFVKSDMAGVENYVGEYYKGETRFLFVWRDSASNEYDEHLIRNLSEVATTIDGERATIRTFTTTRYGSLEYIAELNVGNWHNGDVELYMSIETKNRVDISMARQIFRSVRFSKRGRR
jgi:hypothetical protein